MAPQVSFEIVGDERLVAAVEALGSDDARRQFLTRAALHVEGVAKSNVSGIVLRVRSGGGRSRITHLVDGDSFTVGSPDAYMRAHETGATIVARRARLLTIPLPAAKTAAGVARFSARQAPYAETFWRESKRGNLILFGKQGDRIVPLFLGRTSVRLPRRPWLRPAFDGAVEAMEAILVRTLEERLAAA